MSKHARSGNHNSGSRIDNTHNPLAWSNFNAQLPWKLAHRSNSNVNVKLSCKKDADQASTWTNAGTIAKIYIRAREP
jgi:hypothetical protein